MNKRALGALVGLLGVAGLVALTRDRGAPPAEPSAVSVAPSPAHRAAPTAPLDDTAAAFELHLVDEGTVLATGAAGTQARLVLEGVVALQQVQSAPGWRALSVESVRAVSWTFGGDPLADAAERFQNALVYFRVDDGGAVQEVEAPAALAAPVARVLQAVAFALGEERLAPGDTRVQAVRSPFGVATASLAADPACSGAPCAFDVRFAGADLAQLEQGALATGSAQRRGEVADGALQSVASLESFRVSQADGSPLGERTITLRLTRVPLPRPLPRVTLVDARTPVEDMRGDGVRRGLEQRVSGLTVEAMLGNLRSLAGSRVPDHDRWLWRATGLIQLDPAAAGALADACLDGSLQGPPRHLALELLASVGSPGAQEALRRVFGDEGFSGADDYPAALQRAALIEEPEDATISVLAQQAETLQGAAARSAFVATGAAIGHARAQDPQRASDVVGRLQAALSRTADPIDRRALIMALGNTGAPQTLAALVEAGAAEDAELRTIAARALGHVDTPESAAQLVAMVQDPDAVVQRAAVAALAAVAPNTAQLRALASAVPALPQGTRMALIVLVARLHRDREASDADLLVLIEAIRSRADLPGDAEHQMMGLQRELSGQGAR